MITLRAYHISVDALIAATAEWCGIDPVCALEMSLADFRLAVGPCRARIVWRLAN